MGARGLRSSWDEHRQELVLAAVQVGQRFRLLLRLPLQAAAFADVSNVALSDGPVIHLIDVADELDFGPLAVFGFERQVVVADIARSLAVLGRRLDSPAYLANRPISHSSLPKNSSCV